MTSKLLLFEHSSFKISEAVGAHPPRRMCPDVVADWTESNRENYLLHSELVEGHIHQSLCDDLLEEMLIDIENLLRGFFP